MITRSMYACTHIYIQPPKSLIENTKKGEGEQGTNGGAIKERNHDSIPYFKMLGSPLPCDKLQMCWIGPQFEERKTL